MKKLYNKFKTRFVAGLVVISFASAGLVGCEGLGQAKEKASDIVQKSYLVIKYTDNALDKIKDAVKGLPVAEKVNDILDQVDGGLDVVLDSLDRVGGYLGLDLESQVGVQGGSLEDAIADLKRANDSLDE